MPKKKYLYQDKKILQNLKSPEEDLVYFNSLKFAKTVAEKFGRSKTYLEDIFTRYFRALKDLGITELMSYPRIKNNINFLYFNFNDFIPKYALGLTDGFFEEISLRKSFRFNDISTLIH